MQKYTCFESLLFFAHLANGSGHHILLATKIVTWSYLRAHPLAQFGCAPSPRQKHRLVAVSASMLHWTSPNQTQKLGRPTNELVGFQRHLYKSLQNHSSVGCIPGRYEHDTHPKQICRVVILPRAEHVCCIYSSAFKVGEPHGQQRCSLPFTWQQHSL